MLSPARPVRAARRARIGFNVVLAGVGVLLAAGLAWRCWGCRPAYQGPPSALDGLSRDRLPPDLPPEARTEDLVGLLGPTPRRPEGMLRCVAVSADGSRLATGGRDGVVRL